MEINDIFETKAFESKAFESKAGFPPDAVVTHSEMMRTFDAFKAANDERIDAVERKAADVLHDDKVARIDATLDAQTRRLDELTLKSARPQLGLERAVAPAISREHKAAFESYMRSGDVASLRALEVKAMSIGTPGDGGYLVPEEVEREIGKRLAAISPIRAIASVREISGNVYKKPFMTAGPATGWVAETASRPQTNSPTLDELSFPAAELYAMPAATGALLEDAAVNIDEWIASEVEQVFAVQEGAAFVNGDGTNKPKGFLQYDKVAETSWAWTKIGFIETGVDADFPEEGAADPLRSRLCTESGLSAERLLRDEPQDPERDPQAEGWRRQLSVAAAGAGRRAGRAAHLPGDRGRGHAEYRGRQLLDRVRRFQERLSGGRPPGRARAARSLFRQALCAVLHDQAGRRRRAGLRRHQAAEVQRGVSACSEAPSPPGVRRGYPNSTGRPQGGPFYFRRR